MLKNIILDNSLCMITLDGTVFLNKENFITYLKKNVKDYYKITIPEYINDVKVTHIGCKAFEERYRLAAVQLPETIISIETKAFEKCPNLHSISGLKNVESIDNSAFYRCASLKELDEFKNLKTIGNSAFFGCIELISFIMPDTVTYVGEEAFYSCDSLENIRVSNSLKEIKYRTFADTNVHNVENINSVDKINEYAFASTPFLDKKLATLNSVNKELILGKTLIGISTKEYNRLVISNKAEYISCKLYNNTADKIKIIIPRTVKEIDGCSMEYLYNADIVYKGTVDEMLNLFSSVAVMTTDDDKLIKCEGMNHNVLVNSVYDVDDFINNINVKNIDNENIPELTNNIRKDYFLEVLDEHILNVSDLNKKLSLLSLREVVQNSIIYETGDFKEKINEFDKI